MSKGNPGRGAPFDPDVLAAQLGTHTDFTMRPPDQFPSAESAKAGATKMLKLQRQHRNRDATLHRAVMMAIRLFRYEVPGASDWNVPAESIVQVIRLLKELQFGPNARLTGDDETVLEYAIVVYVAAVRTRGLHPGGFLRTYCQSNPNVLPLAQRLADAYTKAFSG